MYPVYHSETCLSTRTAIRIVITLICLILAVLAGLWLGGGALAFNSPVSPLGTRPWSTPDWWDHTPTVTRAAPDPAPVWTPPNDMWPTPSWYDDGTPLPPSAWTPAIPGPTGTAVFVPISPPVFVPISPLPTPRPEPICIAPGHWGQVLCYD